MAAARLSALAAVGLAVGLAAALPVSPGAGLVSLFGWLGVAVLVLGLLFGYRSAVAAAAVAFVIRGALVSTFDLEVFPPPWAHALLIVLMVELAGASFTLRTRPADPVHILARALLAASLAATLVAGMETLVEGTEASGVLVRAAGLAALVFAAGWVTRIWKRSGLGG